MRPKILLLDQDGPLADFDQGFWNFCQGMGFQMNITSLDDPKRRRFMTDNMTNPKERAIARAYVDSGHNRWFKNLPVTPGALNGVQELLDRDDLEIWVCTKPLEANNRCRDDKALWIEQHFPELLDRLILAPDKSLVRGDVLLDDAPKIKWLNRAIWEPVVFSTAFNGEGSEWAGLRHWSWDDPIGELVP